MICPQCQAMNENTSAFCRNCGTPLATPLPGSSANFGQPAGPAPYVPATAAPASTFRLDLRRLSRVDRAVGIASLIVLISLFLPWFGISALGDSFSVNGTTAHGYLDIVLIVALLLIGYLVLRSGWDEFPFSMPIAHAPLLLVGTGLQLILVLIGFASKPIPGLSWEFGAYLALLAAVAAAAPVVIPAVRSWQQNR
jgi:zinc-ribbon domain